VSTTETKPFILTDGAATKVAELLKAEGDPSLALRVAVRPGGCSGFAYEMFFDSDIAGDDILMPYDGFNIVIDPASAPMLTGASLDYKDTLQGAGFNVINPNATKSCGCGNSFS